jgi:hypothetical protein
MAFSDNPAAIIPDAVLIRNDNHTGTNDSFLRFGIHIHLGIERSLVTLSGGTPSAVSLFSILASTLSTWSRCTGFVNIFPMPRIQQSAIASPMERES